MPDVFDSQRRKTDTIQPRNIDLKKELKSIRGGTHFDHRHKFLTEVKEKDHHSLSSFRFYPDKTDFINKDPEEKVILLLRRHPVTNIGWIVTTILLLLAPSFWATIPFFSQIPEGFQIISILVWYLITASYAFEKFLSWFYQVNIVTDERIFDIDFYNLVSREMTDANIDQIQDVTVRIGSPVRTVFNYGDVVIQTAAQIPEVEFQAVPNPDKVARVLRELRIEEEIEKIEGRIR